MKKITIIILTLFIISCSSDLDEIEFIPEDQVTEEEDEEIIPQNQIPVINAKSFAIAEHSPEGTSIGAVEASDMDGDTLTFTLISGSNLEIDEATGEITIGADLKLDYETLENINFTVSVFDGETIIDQDFILDIENVDETTLLTEEQVELVDYFEYLALQKNDSENSKEFVQKWTSPIKMFISGAAPNDFDTMVEDVLTEYNELFSKSDFTMSTTTVSADANAQLFFGTKADVEAQWPDMYDLIKDGTYSGFAMTPSNNAVLSTTRIWISIAHPVLLRHEFGHVLGFGHSNRCDDELSFMCADLTVENERGKVNT